VSSLSDITGLWHRSLIAWPDGRTDTTTFVRWMQSPSLFVDLRQPTGRPSFEDAGCLRQLGRAHVEWLALQEGFAGEIRFDGQFIEWQREIDLQPMSAFADVGRFWFEGDMMVEEGRDVPYIEHWHRQLPSPQSCNGIGLYEERSGRGGIIVRVGDRFMYARARAFDLPSGLDLRQHIRTVPALHEAQDLIDCEISSGQIGADGWRIEHSSLPFKEGQMLKPIGLQSASDSLETADLAPDGTPITRQWMITRRQGALCELMGGVVNEFKP
jgi:hypothetical protein